LADIQVHHTSVQSGYVYINKPENATVKEKPNIDAIITSILTHSVQIGGRTQGICRPCEET